MSRLSKGFIREVRRFSKIQPGPRPSHIGLRQFLQFESRGVRPPSPHPYFTRLLDGKRWWEWTLNQYETLYHSSDWWGWTHVESDFRDDPSGLHQVERRLRRKKP